MAQGARPVEEPLVRRTIEVRSPATGARVAEHAIADRDAVAAAVARAREAQARWVTLDFAERAGVLKRVRDAFIDGKERIADVVSAETGKPRHDVFTNELFIVCDGIGFWSRRASRYLADEKARPHLMKSKRAYTSYHPHGVIGIIGPWNFPFSLTIGEAIPALMAGNAVVLKPSEVTPGSARVGCELAEAAGLPAGLLQTVFGYGDTGQHLIELADMICFTGSVETGRKVAARCGQLLKPTTLELGGKDPMIVLGDANLERAANACVYGGLVNAGQVCTSVERVYVEAPVYDDFVQKVVDKVKRVRQGPPEAGPVEVGSMTFPPQIEKVERHVQDAVARGARVLAGGKRRPDLPGLFFEPTVLVDVTHDMDIMRDETFGPVIPIILVRGLRQRRDGQLRRHRGADGRHQGERRRPPPRPGRHSQVLRQAGRRHRPLRDEQRDQLVADHAREGAALPSRARPLRLGLATEVPRRAGTARARGASAVGHEPGLSEVVVEPEVAPKRELLHDGEARAIDVADRAGAIAAEELPRLPPPIRRAFDEEPELPRLHRLAEGDRMVDSAPCLQQRDGLGENPFRRDQAQPVGVQPFQQRPRGGVTGVAPVAERDPCPGVDEDRPRGHRLRLDRRGAPYR